MRKYIARVLALSVAALCGMNGAMADNGQDANIYGHVVDKRTGEHLPYITVTIAGTSIGTMTDSSGHYFMHDVPVGKCTIEASSVGYVTVSKQITTSANISTEVNFEIEEAQVSVDAVVVSANRNETKRREAPSLVNIIDAGIFKAANAVCVADGLSFQPGVRVEDDCQNCGFMQVRINGLDGHYSQILIDSRPIFSTLAGVYGLEQIPANMVERIEVVRGGGSALSGASAIGGTVNIITREPVRNTAEVGHTLTSIGRGGTFDNNTTLNASLVSGNGKAGICIYGQNRVRSGYDHDGDGFTELPELSSRMIGMRSYLKVGNYNKISLQYYGIGEYRRGGDNLDLPPHEAMIAEQTDHNIHGGGLSFDGSTADREHRYSVYVSLQNIDRKSYYGSKMDEKAYGATHGLTAVTGAQYTYDCPKMFFMPAELSVGVEYNYDGLYDRSFGYGTVTDQTVHIVSAYLQNEWKNERWGILIGGRLDKHNLISHPIFSPRVNLRYNPVKDVNLRATYSAGFRAPQAFDEDLHISIVGGERVRIALADGLRQERSHSFSISSDMYHRFGNVQTNLLVEGFYTLLDGTFSLRNVGLDADGTVVKERYNGSNAHVMGFNIEARAAFTPWIDAQMGVTVQRSRYKEAEQWSEDETVPPERRMFRTPDVYGYFTATTTPLERFDISLTGTYTGPMLVQHMAGSGTAKDVAVRTHGFFDMGMKVAYGIRIYRSVVLELSAGVRNIFNAYQRDFDTGPDRDSGYVYGPSLPRSWYVGAKFSF